MKFGELREMVLFGVGVAALASLVVLFVFGSTTP